MRHNRIAITVEYGCVSLRMRFFPQDFGTIKRILPGSSSPSHREGSETEVETSHVYIQPRSQGLRGETVTKTLVKFVLSFQNFGKKSHAQ